MELVEVNYPEKIICLTEESVETLFHLGQSHRIAGVSAFVKRPEEAQNLPKVSFFTSSNYKKIAALDPDLILGHSDIQKDIARDLIERGHDVYIANHRSLQGILNYIALLGSMVNAREQAFELVKSLRQKMEYATQFAQSLKRPPLVYFEEWDDPAISCIGWVGELLQLCGAKVLFFDKSKQILAKDRIISHPEVVSAAPDIIFACWCGKKVKLDSIKQRAGWELIPAVKNARVYELAPEIFLQPGPAPVLDGIDIVINYFKDWNEEQV